MTTTDTSTTSLPALRSADLAASTWDSELGPLLAAEEERQQSTINLIARENFASGAVRQALATFLSAKYAEG